MNGASRGLRNRCSDTVGCPGICSPAPAFGHTRASARSVHFPEGLHNRNWEGIAPPGNDLGGLRLSRETQSPTRSPWVAPLDVDRNAAQPGRLSQDNIKDGTPRPEFSGPLEIGRCLPSGSRTPSRPCALLSTPPVRQLRTATHDLQVCNVAEDAVSSPRGQFLHNPEFLEMTQRFVDRRRGDPYLFHQPA